MAAWPTWRKRPDRPRIVIDTGFLHPQAPSGMKDLFDALLARLAMSNRFDQQLYTREGTMAPARALLAAQGLSAPLLTRPDPSGEDVFVSCFGAAPPEWLCAPWVLHAHVVHEPSGAGRMTQQVWAETLDVLDEDTLILVGQTSTRNRLLERRPDLSVRKCHLLDLSNPAQAAALLAAEIGRAHDAHSARPRKRRHRPLRPGAIVDQLRRPDGQLAANFQYFQNGSLGPVFGARPPAPATTGWPLWSERLPGQTPARPEGGRRLTGRTKSSAPGAPLVSYVTIVRNNATGLARAIDSVQSQTHPNVEHVILDGASTDGTVDLLAARATEIDYYVSEPDAGLYDAMNKAIPLARGDLICALNSDDWLTPEAAAIAVERMAGIPGPAMLFSAANVPDRSTEWYPGFVHPGCYFKLANDCHNAIYATRTAYEASGPYDTRYRIAADFKWIMACLDAGVRGVYTRERTINYSLGGASSNDALHSAEVIQVARDRFPDLSEREAAGLHALFFELSTPDAPFASAAERTQFLRDVFAAHGDRPDLIEALGWAMVERMAFSDSDPLLKKKKLSRRKRWRQTRRDFKAWVLGGFRRRAT